MEFTKEQISSLICKHAEKKNGLHDIFEFMLESMMVAERSEYLRSDTGNKGNGYRLGHTYGQGRRLEFRIPRDRYGNFHPQILAILRSQEEECDRLAGVLYTKGLTQEQVGDVFDQIYGEHYSKSSISRMVDCVRTQVSSWLERGLEEYYPVVFVDCVHIKIHRKRSVASEAFYVALAVTEEGRREVLGIFNMPTESATGWGGIFDKLKERGVERVGLMVADGHGTYYQLGAFPLYNCGNMFTVLSRRGRPQFPNYKGYDLNRYMHFERRGNQLFARTSADGVSWENMPGSPVSVREPRLSIGIYQTTYTARPSWVKLADLIIYAQ